MYLVFRIRADIPQLIYLSFILFTSSLRYDPAPCAKHRSQETFLYNYTTYRSRGSFRNWETINGTIWQRAVIWWERNPACDQRDPTGCIWGSTSLIFLVTPA